MSGHRVSWPGGADGHETNVIGEPSRLLPVPNSRELSRRTRAQSGLSLNGGQPKEEIASSCTCRCAVADDQKGGRVIA
ncbi:hypothetical protein KM043_016174 [Ampulex compressa]|nr:hypothetical protein KM043_016174 [Ampulex compressa]